MILQKCNHCGRPFEGRPNRAYCSSSCKSAINNHRFAERDKETRASERKIRSNQNILAKLHELLGNVKLPEAALEKSSLDFEYKSGTSVDGQYIFFHSYVMKRLPNQHFQILKTAELNA